MCAPSKCKTQVNLALVDEKIFAWHQEAEGSKIRHVPASLPDMLKTDDILRWEYAPSLGKTTEQAMGASNDRLEWMRSARSDYEIAIPLSEIESFARGDGAYRRNRDPLFLGVVRQAGKSHDTCRMSLRNILIYRLLGSNCAHILSKCRNECTEVT